MSSFDRELFPLPAPFPPRIDPWSSDAHGRPVRSLARSVQRRLFKREHLESWCNDGAQTLNELSGAPYNVLAPHSKNNGQDVCVSHLQRVYSGVPKPPLEFTPAGAFIELCGSASRYDPASASETSVAPYDKDVVSWPPIGSEPAPVLANLSGADFEMVNGWEQCLLKNATDVSSYRISPTDPVPILSPAS